LFYFIRNSKKEHLFEITLPKSARVGHLDLKFSLQPGCVSLPSIEVTLYRALKNKPKLSPSTSTSQIHKTKAASNEFLKSINAVAVCGPLELGSNLDLSGQGGNVVLTSPTLVLNKGRNFYLHIRAKSLARADSAETSVCMMMMLTCSLLIFSLFQFSDSCNLSFLNTRFQVQMGKTESLIP